MSRKHSHSYSHEHSHEEGHPNTGAYATQPHPPVPVVRDPNLHSHISRYANSEGIVYIAERTHSHGWAGIPGDPHDHAFAPWNMEPTGEIEVPE